MIATMYSINYVYILISYVYILCLYVCLHIRRMIDNNETRSERKELGLFVINIIKYSHYPQVI